MLAIGLSFVAALGFGSAAILARVGMQGVRPLSGAFISMVVSTVPAVLLALIFTRSDIRALPAIAIFWFLCLGAVNFLGGRTQNFRAISRVGASRSSVIIGTSSVFATLFAITITGERPHFVVPLGTAAVVIGLVVSTGGSIRRGWSGNRNALTGYALALIAAASYGGTDVIAKELTQAYGSPLMISAFSLIFGVLSLAPMAGREALRDFRTAGSDLTFVVFAGLSGLSAATAVISLYYALERADVVVVAPIVSANPLLTLLLARLFISRLERITRDVVYGAVLTIGGIVVVVVGSTL